MLPTNSTSSAKTPLLHQEILVGVGKSFCLEWPLQKVASLKPNFRCKHLSVGVLVGKDELKWLSEFTHLCSSCFIFCMGIKVCLSLCRSCRVAPLIQCDYCPLLFHMDCLEPPLTAMPLGRWMCPNHIEHVVVSRTMIAVW